MLRCFILPLFLDTQSSTGCVLSNKDLLTRHSIDFLVGQLNITVVMMKKQQQHHQQTIAEATATATTASPYSLLLSFWPSTRKMATNI